MRVTSALLQCAAVALLVSGCGDDDDGSRRAPLSPNPPLVVGAASGRPASVVLPADYSIDAEYPLVILLHGFGVNALTQDFVFRLTPRTTDLQFILVLPDGTVNAQGSRFWDATPECCNFGGPPIDDVGYLASLMEEAMEIYAVDADRIRLVGHSNGGYMAYRYACEHPVAVDRIAVLAGSTFIESEACEDPRPIDVLHMHGTLDETILYPANLPPDGNPSKVDTIGAEAAVARWAAIADCTDLDLIERLTRARGESPGDLRQVPSGGRYGLHARLSARRGRRDRHIGRRLGPLDLSVGDRRDDRFHVAAQPDRPRPQDPAPLFAGACHDARNGRALPAAAPLSTRSGDDQFPGAGLFRLRADVPRELVGGAATPPRADDRVPRRDSPMRRGGADGRARVARRTFHNQPQRPGLLAGIFAGVA